MEYRFWILFVVNQLLFVILSVKIDDDNQKNHIFINDFRFGGIVYKKKSAITFAYQNNFPAIHKKAILIRIAPQKYLHCDRIFHCRIRTCLGDDFGVLQTKWMKIANKWVLIWVVFWFCYQIENGSFFLPFETEFNCKYRKPSVTSFERSLIGLKNDLCKSSGRLSPRINLQWFTKSAAVCMPFGISTSSSCESMLLIFGAELNDPILKQIHKNQMQQLLNWF